MDVKTIFKSTSVNLLASFIVKISFFIATYLLAKYSNDQNVANFGLVVVTLGAFQSFITMGLGVTAVKVATAKKNNSIEEISYGFYCISIIYHVSFLIFLIFIFLFKEFILNILINSTFIYDNFTLLILVLYFQCACDIKYSFNIGLGKFLNNLLANIIGVIGFSLSLLYFIFIDSSFGIFTAWLSLSVGSWIVLYCYKNKFNFFYLAKNHLNFRLSDLKSILSFAIPVFLASLIVAPVNFIVIGMYTKVENAHSIIALITIANQLLGMFAIIPVIFSQVLASRINLDVSYSQVKMCGIIIFFVSLLFVGLFSIFVDSFLNAYNLDIISKNTLLLALGVGVLLGVQAQFDTFNLCNGASRIHLVLNILFSVIFILCAYFLEKTAFNYVYSRFLGYTVRLIILFCYLSLKNKNNMYVKL